MISFDEVGCANHAIPTKQEIKDMCLWLATTGWNDHSFGANVHVIGTILHHAGMFESSDYVLSMMDDWRNASRRQEYAESIVRYLENL